MVVGEQIKALDQEKYKLFYPHLAAIPEINACLGMMCSATNTASI